METSTNHPASFVSSVRIDIRELGVLLKWLTRNNVPVTSRSQVINTGLKTLTEFILQTDPECDCSTEQALEIVHAYDLYDATKARNVKTLVTQLQKAPSIRLTGPAHKSRLSEAQTVLNQELEAAAMERARSDSQSLKSLSSFPTEDEQ